MKNKCVVRCGKRPVNFGRIRTKMSRDEMVRKIEDIVQESMSKFPEKTEEDEVERYIHVSSAHVYLTITFDNGDEREYLIYAVGYNDGRLGIKCMSKEGFDFFRIDVLTDEEVNSVYESVVYVFSEIDIPTAINRIEAAKKNLDRLYQDLAMLVKDTIIGDRDLDDRNTLVFDEPCKVYTTYNGERHCKYIYEIRDSCPYSDLFNAIYKDDEGNLSLMVVHRINDETKNVVLAIAKHLQCVGYKRGICNEEFTAL